MNTTDKTLFDALLPLVRQYGAPLTVRTLAKVLAGEAVGSTGERASKERAFAFALRELGEKQ
jgi:hypothetical protein